MEKFQTFEKWIHIIIRRQIRSPLIVKFPKFPFLLKTFIHLVVAPLLLPLTGTAQIALNNGLAYHFPLNGTLRDIANHSSTANGDSTTTCADYLHNPGGALCFNGINNTTTLYPGKTNIVITDFSISVWFKVNAAGFLADTGKVECILDKRINCQIAPGDLSIRANAHEVYWEAMSLNGNYYIHFSGYRQDQWNHLALVLHNDSITTYLNGLVTGNDTLNSILLEGFSGSELQISSLQFTGCKSAVPFQSLNGGVSDLRLYGRSLNRCEIMALYLADTNGICDQLNICPSLTVNLNKNNPLPYTGEWTGLGVQKGSVFNAQKLGPGSYLAQYVYQGQTLLKKQITVNNQTIPVIDTSALGTRNAVCLDSSGSAGPIKFQGNLPASVQLWINRADTGTPDKSIRYGPDDRQLSITGLKKGIYYYLALDALGCPVTQTGKLVIQSDSCPDIRVYQLITPNNDQKNDCLFIDELFRYPQNEVSILSRSGIVVMQTSGYQDGHWCPGELPEGTYYYKISIPRKQKTYTGSLLIAK